MYCPASSPFICFFFDIYSELLPRTGTTFLHCFTIFVRRWC
jgi:hypothetical protein